MRPIHRFAIAATLAAALAPFAAAQNRATVYTANVDISDGPLRRTQVNIVKRSNLHPNLAVSRSVSEQAVHPHLVEVQLNSNGDAMTTYVDPLVNPRITGRDSSIDDGHWLARVSQAAGVTTSQLNAAAASRQHIKADGTIYSANRATVTRPFTGRATMRYSDYSDQPMRIYMPVNRQRNNQPAPAPAPRNNETPLGDSPVALR